MSAGADEPAEELPASYEVARAELVQVVATLEAGGASLEESIRLWERAEALADACERFLAGARTRLDAVTSADDEAGGS